MIIKYNHMEVPVVHIELPYGVFGEFSFFPYPSIHINRILKEEERTSTMLHEVLEMISEVNGLKLNETQIRVLEVGLLSVFSQNPALRDRICGKATQRPVQTFQDWTPSQTLPDSPEAL